MAVASTLPDGTTGPTQTFSLAEGQDEVVATVETTFTGTNPVHGDAAVTVEPSGLHESAPVSYRCPTRP